VAADTNTFFFKLHTYDKKGSVTQTSRLPGRERSAPHVADSATAHAIAGVEISHSYGRQPALKGLSLSVAPGEFCTLLGPSGSGKTTLLRIFAGLLAPTSGRVEIDGVDVTDRPVQRRDIGFVFQNYALFPHLTVADNVAFPLRMRRMGRRERVERVAEALRLVALEGFGHRYPAQLSGGQQQRVAVARALVFEPRVLLLDEPLGALDRRLRQQLGADLRRIQQATDTTAVYVTHDQEEAFLLSDTVVVMNDGEICQQGSPVDVYTEPRDLFSATFLGDTNVLSGPVIERTGDRTTIDVDGVPVVCRGGGEIPLGVTLSCSVRPEDIEVVRPSEPEDAGRFLLGMAEVEQVIFLGSRFRLGLLCGTRRLVAEVARAEQVLQVGDVVRVGWASGVPVAVAPSRDVSEGSQ